MFFSPRGNAKIHLGDSILRLFVLTLRLRNFPALCAAAVAESPVPSIPILVSDFELFSVVPRAASPAATVHSFDHSHCNSSRRSGCRYFRLHPLQLPSAAPIATAPSCSYRHSSRCSDCRSFHRSYRHSFHCVRLPRRRLLLLPHRWLHRRRKNLHCPSSNETPICRLYKPVA